MTKEKSAIKAMDAVLDGRYVREAIGVEMIDGLGPVDTILIENYKSEVGGGE